MDEQREAYEIRLDKLEEQRQEAVTAYSKSEKEHSHIIQSYKKRLSDLADNTHRLEAKLRACETSAEEQLLSLQVCYGNFIKEQKSMTSPSIGLCMDILSWQNYFSVVFVILKREYSAGMEKMKEKMVELQQQLSSMKLEKEKSKKKPFLKNWSTQVCNF